MNLPWTLAFKYASEEITRGKYKMSPRLCDGVRHAQDSSSLSNYPHEMSNDSYYSRLFLPYNHHLLFISDETIRCTVEGIILNSFYLYRRARECYLCPGMFSGRQALRVIARGSIFLTRHYFVAPTFITTLNK